VTIREHARSMMMTDRRFAQLMSSHAEVVTSYARAMAPDAWMAEDAVQETFLRAWKYRDTFRASGSFEGWLIRICRNCLARLAARTPFELTADPPELAEESDGCTELYDLLGRLPLEQREVLVLCALLGYDYAGTAELLGVPIGTVASRLYRARATIAGQLEEPGKEAQA